MPVPSLKSIGFARYGNSTDLKGSELCSAATVAFTEAHKWSRPERLSIGLTGYGSQIGAIATANCGSSAMVQNTVSSLPLSLAPRGLSRVQSAEYIGVGVTKFDEMVVDGRMPKPKRIDGRTVWDRVLLDEAFEALDNEAVAKKNHWDEF
jgi:predicted DNA-binding transcriptional regulator AlpA